MATIKKAQNGMSKTLDKTSIFGKNYTPATAKEKAQAAKQAADMKKKAAAGKPFKMGGKAKSGGSFPDLNHDGKITKADILKGRGVIAKKGAKVKPCMNCGGKMKSGGMMKMKKK
jgi:hypothetical protein